MNKIFEINSMEQKRTDSGCSVTFKIVINGHDYDLKYDIFCKDITQVPERCDSVVVSFLMFATRFGLDIHSKLPISKALLYNITKHFLPQLYLCHPKATNKIKLNIPVTDKRFFGKWRGTGVSLGVDSFATIHEYTDDCPYDEYKLTHLVHLKTGAQYGASVSKEYNAETEQP